MICNEHKPALIYTGEDKTVSFRLTGDYDLPFDLTLATDIIVMFPTPLILVPIPTPGLPIVKKLSLSQVTIVSAIGGRFDVPLAAVDTITLEVGKVIPVEIKIIIAGLTTIVQIPEALDVVQTLF